MKMIYFDFFNVISSPAYKKILPKYVPENEMPEWDKKIDLVDLGEMHEDEFMRQLSRRARVPEFQLWEEVDSEIVINEQLIAYIKELKQSYKIGLLTNAARSLIGRIFADQLDIFDVVIISSDLGLIKPDHRIYEIAISQAQIPAQEIVFVDDRVENIEAAITAGMQGIVYTNLLSLKQDLQKYLS